MLTNKGKESGMKKATRIFLYVVIAGVCVVTLACYISSLICGVPAFWADPIPLFDILPGLCFNNFDMTSIGLPVCGICLMLLYIDLKQRKEKRV